MKGMHEKDLITEVFMKKELQAYLHKHYQIIPVMVNRNKIKKVKKLYPHFHTVVH